MEMYLKMSKPKLLLEDKLAIATTTDSGRKLASKYDVHQSAVSAVRREARVVLEGHWGRKSASIGRPRKVADKEVAVTKKLLEKMEKDRQILEIERDWARLQHKLAEDKLEDVYWENEKKAAKKKKISKQKK